MSDTNEERLLSRLLSDVAKADEDLVAPAGLELRVMAGWDARAALPPVARRWTVADHPWVAPLGAATLGVAGLGAAAAALVMGVSTVMQLGVTTTTRRADPGELKPPVAVAAAQPAEMIQETVAMSPKPSARRASRPPRLPDAQNEIVRFVPLFPMTADELSGSFSIARVQIGQTEAEVLLGEDGMARAIRVATNETAPWRLR